MPIPAQNPATASVNFDSLLIRTLIYSGGSSFTLQLARYASASGIIQPGSISMIKVTDATANAALQNLIAQFLAIYGLTGPATTVVINGKINATIPNGSVRVATASGEKMISDANAEAVKTPAFGGIFQDFEAAIAAYNATAKVI